MYYMGFTYVEAYNIPVWQRVWFIQRLNQEFQKAAESNPDSPPPSKAAHSNSAAHRQMMGRNRAQVPARLRRFT